MKYVLGVDGGNTKTDYFLFNEKAEFVDHLRAGTCSHEALDDEFDGAYRVMKECITKLLSRNKLTVDDVAAATFGLAGVDVPFQKVALENIVKKIGFKKFAVVNDSAIGIKAGTSKGYGICCVNGTGTSNSGIDQYGGYLQVGGIGDVSCDFAGGGFVAEEVIRAVYSAAFRMGDATSLSEIVYQKLGIEGKEDLMDGIANVFKRRRFNYTDLTIACFEEANKGDKVALDILYRMGDNCAKSGAGLITNLNFGDEVDVCLVGSVWVKGACPHAINTYKEKIAEYTGKKINVNVLTVPPATGAIIWALELLTGVYPSYDERQQIIKIVSEELNKK